MTPLLLPLLLILTPLIGAVLMLLPIQEFNRERSPWAIALLASLISLGLATAALLQTITGQGPDSGPIGGSVAWLPELGVNLTLALDGVSVWLVMLVAAIGPTVIIASRGQVNGNPKPYYLCLLYTSDAADD